MFEFFSINGRYLENKNKNINDLNHKTADGFNDFDYSYIHSITRIALYDDLLSAPQITEIQPDSTGEYIAKLASKIYEQAKCSGGSIPYTIIREVAENFIHAQFTEATVSIYDKGNTIRFTDQGPGILQKDQAQQPGFTSAISPMKSYIRGVGSGLPIVREYLDISQGTISIEDNLNSGAVVTISLKKDFQKQDCLLQNQSTIPYDQLNHCYIDNNQQIYYQNQVPQQYLLNNAYQQTNQHNYSIGQNMPDEKSIVRIALSLTTREKEFLKLLLSQEILGVTDFTKLTGIAASSVYTTLTNLENDLLIEKTGSKKRVLTSLGNKVALSL